VPVVTLLAEALLLGVLLTPIKALGGLLTILGVVLTQLRPADGATVRLPERSG